LQNPLAYALANAFFYCSKRNSPYFAHKIIAVPKGTPRRERVKASAIGRIPPKSGESVTTTESTAKKLVY